MKVLQIINGEFYSGAERVQDLLALNLPSFGYEVGFACVKPGRFPGQRIAKAAPLHLVPMRSRFDLTCAWRLGQIVRTGGYKLIHSHSPRAALVGNIAAKIAGIPMVHHVHSPTARDTENAVRNRVNSLVEELSLTGVKKLIPVSRSLELHLLAHNVKRRRIRMIPNGVPTPGTLPQRSTPEGEWTIGCVALFRPRKGLEVLLRALFELRRSGRAVRLHVVGPFETVQYHADIKKLAEQLSLEPNIEWIDFTQDVNAEMARMDLFVLPSLFGEGMPMVVLEAMAMGVPVIASNVEGIPEVVHHGVTGLTVPPDDAESLAAGLGSLMDSPATWSSMRASAYRRQVEEYSATSMAHGVADVYRGVLADE
jgi:glycosyltransferase involved in cell wall biosynthesis